MKKNANRQRGFLIIYRQPAGGRVGEEDLTEITGPGEYGAAGVLSEIPPHDGSPHLRSGDSYPGPGAAHNHTVPGH